MLSWTALIAAGTPVGCRVTPHSLNHMAHPSMLRLLPGRALSPLLLLPPSLAACHPWPAAPWVAGLGNNSSPILPVALLPGACGG